jgi:Putative lumazine-binding
VLKKYKPVATGEYTAVVQVASQYVEGMRLGDSAVTSEAFHEEAIMYGFNDGQLVRGPIENLYDFIDNHDPARDVVAHSDVLAITPTTAIVRVEMELDVLGKDYIDYLTLIKIDGAWKVITKVFHQFEG